MWTHLESGTSVFVFSCVFFLLTDTPAGGWGGGEITLVDNERGLRQIAVSMFFFLLSFTCGE